ncbi:hypothetical protein OVW20_08045, partial [Klebsiella pneumoniae]|nr:hypothetical protein [Klebsiella pneumoniae]
QTETEATGAPQKHHYTLNQQVGSITAANSVQATYFIPFNAFIVAIGLYWAISILLELLIKRLTAWGAKRGMSHA